MTDHLYGDEPECALCGHYGPDNDERPCLSQLEAGKLVHALVRRAKATEAERDAVGKLAADHLVAAHAAEADAARLAEALRGVRWVDTAECPTSEARTRIGLAADAALAAHDAGTPSGAVVLTAEEVESVLEWTASVGPDDDAVDIVMVAKLRKARGGG